MKLKDIKIVCWLWWNCHENHFDVLLVSLLPLNKLPLPHFKRLSKRHTNIKIIWEFQKTEQLSPKESILIWNNLRGSAQDLFVTMWANIWAWRRCRDSENEMTASPNAAKCNIANKRWRYLIPFLFISSLFLPCLNWRNMVLRPTR